MTFKNDNCIFLSVNAIYAFANNQQPKREGLMWICEQKFYNNGLVTADVYEANEKGCRYEERESYDIYWDAFKTFGEAMDCKTEALAENA